MSAEPTMGPQNDQVVQERTDWFPLYGKFTTRVEKDHPQAPSEPRVNKNGDEVYEIGYSSFAGNLKAINTFKTEKFGMFLLVTLEANEEIHRFWLKLYGFQSRAFMNYILNANISRPIKLSLKQETGDDKVVRTSLYVSEWRDEENDYGNNWFGVKYKYPKWAGLPEPTTQMVEGEERNDYTARTDALRAVIEKELVPFLDQTGPMHIDPSKPESNPPPATPKKPIATPQLGPEKEEEDDDLPF